MGAAPSRRYELPLGFIERAQPMTPKVGARCTMPKMRKQLHEPARYYWDDCRWRSTVAAIPIQQTVHTLWMIPQFSAVGWDLTDARDGDSAPHSPITSLLTK